MLKESKELEVVVEMVKSGVQENASTAMSQHEYQQRYDSLVDRYDILKAQFDSLSQKRQSKLDRDHELELFIEGLRYSPLAVSEWQARLWILLLDHATVFSDGHIDFTFKNGTVVKVPL